MTAHEDTGILQPLRQLLANRDSPESRALYLQLAQFAHGRVNRLANRRYADLVSAAEQEEVVGEVLYQLMSGTLAQFRGQSLAELLAFVRTITDRCLWRAARKRIRERDAVTGESAEDIIGWTPAPQGPDQSLLAIPEPPLGEQDTQYLLALLQAGSQADLARVQGVSRAAVTQRIQRIRKRIEALTPQEQDAAETWLRCTAARLEAEFPQQ